MIEVALENAERPASQSEQYRFFRNEKTGQTFKARQEARTSPDNSPALCISVAPVDEHGKALLNPLGEPDIYWLTHSFYPEEMDAPDFDLGTRVSAILHEAVRAKEQQLALRPALIDFGETWAGSKALPLPPIPVLPPPDEA